MSSNSTENSHECEVCAVVGLPILPLRYALAWSGDDVPNNKRAPRLESPFSASVYPSLDTAHAHYTLRLLRGGYLYVYDEARFEWSAYEVSPGGTLFAFDIDEGPGLGEKPASVKCMRDAPPSLGRCIQVKDADKAGKLWMAHSDTRWTSAVKATHADAAYRAKHMRCIDVGAWFRSDGTQSQPHLSALKEVFARVGEYALEAAAALYHSEEGAEGESTTLGVDHMRPVNVVAEPAFMFSPYDFAALPRDDFRGIVLEARPDIPLSTLPYAMVALGDPVGITAEVAALMDDRLEGFMAVPERVRPMAVSAAIMQMRDAVGHQAVLKAASTTHPAGHREYEVVRRTADGTFDPEGGAIYTAQQLKDIRENAWEDSGCSARYDEAARRAWQDANDAELKELSDGVIEPLALAHVALLESAELDMHLQCNHDPKDVQSGAGYMAAVLSCIADTQDKPSHADLYARWMDGSPQQRNNLLLRAFALNQDHLAAEIVEAVDAAGKVKWERLPWSYLFGLYNGALDASGNGTASLVAILIKKTLGPAAGMLSRASDAPVKLYALVAWGMAGNVPLEKVELKGKTSGAIVREVMLALEKASGQRPRYQAVHAEIRRLKVLGLNTAQMSTDAAFIGVQKDSTLVSGEHYRAQRAGFISNKLGNWQSVMDSDLRAGLAGSVLSAVALYGLYKDATSSMSHEREESWMRVLGSTVSLIGGAVEMVGKKLERIGLANPRFARFSVVGEFVAKVGSRVAAAGGFLLALLDLVRGYKELRRKNFKMMGLYWASSIAGAGLAFSVLVASLLWGSIFLVIAFLVAIAMMVWGDGMHHAWLDRCWWGRLKVECYEDEMVEMEEYKLAMGAL